MDGVTEEVIEGDCTPWMDSGVVVKQEPAWSMEEDSPDQPPTVYSTVQHMSDNTSGSLLSLERGHVCQHCSAAFVLVSSLELHLASVHGEPLPFLEWTESSDRQMSLLHGRLSTEETDHVRNYSANSDTEFVLKLEPAWSMDEDSPDQPSAVYSTVQPMSDNTSESLLSSTPYRCDAGDCSSTDRDKEVDSHGNRKITTKLDVSDTGDKDGKKSRRQHVCDVCRKSFLSPSALGRHRLIHSGVKAFACDICSKSFSQAGHLKAHKLSHGSYKPFVCDVCSKSFSLASNLTQHKRIHTWERPYKCQHCDSAFKQPGSLYKHVKSVHEDARPYVCDVCGAAFSQTCILRNHKRIHTGEKPHVCSDCGKGFAQSSTLIQHRLTHSGEKPHSCPHCPSAYKWSQDLKKHIKRKHQ